MRLYLKKIILVEKAEVVGENSESNYNIVIV